MAGERDILPLSALQTLPEHRLSPNEIDSLWRSAVEKLRKKFGKILVLDDDPTGSQTVYSLPVYTDYSRESLEAVRRDESHVVYLLTNSRSLHSGETEELHRELMGNWQQTGNAEGETLFISRSDSTLRGHFPLETDIIADAAYPVSGAATVLLPFFAEGGRFTFGDIHYVREGDKLVPAGMTEFAADSSFGYTRSNLPAYVEEKTDGRIPVSDVRTIGLSLLRRGELAEITRILSDCDARSVIAVNAADYDDLKIFAAALARSCDEGNRFVLRSAASIVKVLAGLEGRELLTRDEMLLTETGLSRPGPSPGLLVAGSYVGKTTKQLARLVESGALVEIKLNIREALQADSFQAEVERVREKVQDALASGKSVGLYTANGERREFLRADEGEEGLTDLELSARISSGLVDLVAGLDTAPSWIITKGGITSHDIACRSLRIRKAVVLGQILPGVPVWRCGSESRWPGIPLVIFPGNVGDDSALTRAVATLAGSVGKVDRKRNR